MNILKMRYFVEVARCGSFSEAAQRLYTTQPNLSKQISQLEQELGFPLFLRSHRKLKLTPAGEYLYHAWDALPDQIDTDIDRAAALSRRGESSLVIGVLEGQDVNAVLRERLQRVDACYPNLNVSLERNSYSNLRSGIRSGHYDIIITLSFDVEDAEDLNIVPLYEKVPAIAIPSSHPLAQKENLSIRDLRDERFVVISREECPGGFRRFVDSCAEVGFTPNIVREPRSLESLLLCVEMGLGVALLDQNTRLELSPDIRTIPQDAAPMAVVAVTSGSEDRPMLLDILRMLTEKQPDPKDR